MKDVIVLKLGGSIITDKKSGKPVLRASRIKEIASEIKRARANNQNQRLILLHGAGSFGHPLAHRYHLLDAQLSAKTLFGVGYTVSAMRELGTLLARVCLDAGLPVVPLQTSSFVRMRNGRPEFTDTSILETILSNGGIPMFGGDVIFADAKRTAVVSADALAVALSKKFTNAHLYFASDVDGVYASLPPKKHEQPLETLDRTAIQNFLKTQKSLVTKRDVTGAMPGKLKTLLNARKTTALIFNGNVKGIFLQVFWNKKIGTRIKV